MRNDDASERVEGRWSLDGGRTAVFVPTGGRWQEYRTRYTIRRGSSPVTDLDGNAAADFSRSFTTVVLDPSFEYLIQEEAEDERVLASAEVSSQRVVRMQALEASAAERWYLSPITEDVFRMRNQQFGDRRGLSAGGSAPATMAPTAEDDNQAWYFTRIGPRVESPTEAESRDVFWLQNIAEGESRSLTVRPTGPAGVTAMGPRTTAAGSGQRFYFRRIGER